MAVGLPINAGSPILAATIAAIAPISIIKQADESVTSSTVMQNDNELVLNLPTINAQYLFALFLDYEGGTQGSSDIKWQFTVPSGAALRYTGAWIGTGGGAVTGTLNSAGTVQNAGSSGAGNTHGILAVGTLQVATTTGTIQLQWAQNTSSGTATIVHAQSFIAMWRII